MKILSAAALAAVIFMPAIEVNAHDQIKWACYPNLVCDRHVGVAGLGQFQDRADGRADRGPSEQAAEANAPSGGTAPGGNPGAAAGAGRPNNDRADRDRDPCRR